MRKGIGFFESFGCFKRKDGKMVRKRKKTGRLMTQGYSSMSMLMLL